MPQAAKLADSLKVLPVVRQEAAAWQNSSRYYRQSADSLRRANTLNLEAVRAVERAFDGQQLLTANQFARAELWQGKARKRGLFNWLLVAVIGGLTYTAIKY